MTEAGRTPVALTHLLPVAWGKRKYAEGNLEYARLALHHHCMDVAAVLEALLALPTLRSRLERLAGTALPGALLARLAVLTFLHDVGKVSAGFQSKSIADDHLHTWLRTHRIDPDERGHTLVAAPLFADPGFQRTAAEIFPLRDIAAWSKSPGNGVRDLWLASISHHGTPITMQRLKVIKERHSPHLWRPTNEYDPRAALACLGDHARKWFPEAWADGGPPLPDSNPFVHAFAGLISLADWIASNDADDFFPYITPGDADRAAFARKRARSVLHRMRIDVEDARADLRRRNPSFTDVFRDPVTGTGQTPTPVQTTVADPALGPVVVVESETGSGKTEAALWRFRTLFAAGAVDSLAFVLPTRAAAVSLEARIRSFLQSLFPDPGVRPNVVLAVPGYLRADGHDGTLLARFETQWPDTAADRHRTWAAEAPKRYLAAAAAVGTVDQVLLSSLRVSHAHLRGAALLRAMLVVDEVHASDPYMTTLLTNVLHRHVDAGGHALLLSATLGGHARDNLVLATEAHVSDPPTAAPIDAPYPAISDRTGTLAVPGTGRTKTVHVHLHPFIGNPDAIAALATRMVADGGKVLIVRNTVAGAIAVHQALEARAGPDHPALFRAGGQTAPHHGRFAGPDRKLLDQAVEDAFGKLGNRTHPTILAGTQTLEQSLDIDADVLVTDLAPADILLQRIGRLHRHQRSDRAPAFTQANVHVLVPADRDLSSRLQGRGPSPSHGIGTVYEHLLAIEATWRRLATSSTIVIPDANRRFVEDATNPESLRQLARTLGPAWVAHADAMTGTAIAQTLAADASRLDWSSAWDDLRWPELGERLQTRLGLGARTVTFPEPFTSPFGQSIANLNLPAWMVPPDVPHDAVPNILVHESPALYFQWGSATFIYSHLGLARADPPPPA